MRIRGDQDNQPHSIQVTSPSIFLFSLTSPTPLSLSLSPRLRFSLLFLSREPRFFEAKVNKNRAQTMKNADG